MAHPAPEEQFHKQRVRTAFVSVTVSMALVLFVVGVMASLLLQARQLGRELQENFTFTAFLAPNTSASTVRTLQQMWSKQPEVRSVVFVSKDQAAVDFQKDLGEEFVDFLGMNPLSDALDLKLHAEYLSPDQLDALEKRLRKEPAVEDLVYDRDLLGAVHQNMDRIALFLTGIAAALLLISVTLIHNSIRLSIYAKRFVIRTMQLVGATKSFIHRPFLLQGIQLGAFGGGTAALLLAGLYQGLAAWAPEMAPFLNWTTWALVSAGLLVLGLLITLASTFFAVNKYLRLHTDKLYAQ
jgi:cell division transport system permease protein